MPTESLIVSQTCSWSGCKMAHKKEDLLTALESPIIHRAGLADIAEDLKGKIASQELTLA